MKHAIVVDDMLCPVRSEGRRTAVHVNGAGTSFPVRGVATDMFEAIEVYRRRDDVPMIQGEAYPCGVALTLRREVR
ncbi:MAG: hypothetical protein PVH00_00985 [Gemmatimonadota bacterium]|jgi:hypothetical protein